jgi:hypothetical protein
LCAEFYQIQGNCVIFFKNITGTENNKNYPGALHSGESHKNKAKIGAQENQLELIRQKAPK